MNGAANMSITQSVLVVIVNNERDWQRVIEQGWYRIPVKTAPTPLAADYLAFYFTKVFGNHAWQIRYYAPVVRYRIVTRADLLPAEVDHPRAGDQYYRVDLDAVRELRRPIISRSLRRITFIPTTWDLLSSASDVAELWQQHDATSQLWADFPEVMRKASSRLELEERRVAYRLL